ncbi:MAG TPA: molybdate ABC transporter substrate-binding protein [Microthrixaceae bacterium]|nr:molybdate ABC transporter substrate-binding protein [Microthrixaceae bacterium]
MFLTGVLGLVLLVGGCSGGAGGTDNGSVHKVAGGKAAGGEAADGKAAGASAEGSASLTGSVTVSAAASLTESFTRIKDDFVQANPGSEVIINFGSSGQLATQIHSGAPVDVAAFADTTPMDALAKAGLISGEATTFALNELVIVTKPRNPQRVKSLADLADVGTISLCNDNAPCGKFADRILSGAGVDIPVSSITRGMDVKATLAAVIEGDAVAGIVYVTDAASAGDRVESVRIPGAQNVTASYPIGVVSESSNRSLADAFVRYVTGVKGQAVLKKFGFLAP